MALVFVFHLRLNKSYFPTISTMPSNLGSTLFLCVLDQVNAGVSIPAREHKVEPIRRRWRSDASKEEGRWPVATSWLRADLLEPHLRVRSCSGLSGAGVGHVPARSHTVARNRKRAVH